MDLRAVLMGLGFALMWSSAFTSARIIVADAPPLLALAVRFAISGLIAVLIARLLGQSARLSPVQWRATILFGVCQNALYLGLNFIAMQTVEASLAAIIASTMPLLVALLGWLIMGEALRAQAGIGLVIGMIGVALIMGSRFGGGLDLYGVLLCAIGALALSIATLSLRGAMSGGNVMMIVGLQMLVGSAALAPFSLLLEDAHVNWSGELIIAFAYTTLVPGLVATLLWMLLVERIGAVRAATFHFLNPFFGVLIAALILNEALRPLDLVGVGVIAAGIFLVQTARLQGKSGGS